MKALLASTRLRGGTIGDVVRTAFHGACDYRVPPARSNGINGIPMHGQLATEETSS